MRYLRRGLGLAGALLLLLASLLFLADTRLGHHWVARSVSALTPANGLRIDVADIDGSLYGAAQIKGLRLSDPHGVFFAAPQVDLVWSPLAWFANRLDITRLHAPRATWYRLPKLRPARPDAPLLPDFDVHIGTLVIDRLAIEKGVTGQAQTGQLRGHADIRDGQARLALTAHATRGDHVQLRLDVVPDQNRFDADLRLDTPRNGLFGAMIGTRDPVALRLAGDGTWTQWAGQLTARRAGSEVARLALSARAGRYAVQGRVAPAALPAGRLRTLAGPSVAVRGAASMAHRRIKGELGLSAPAATLLAQGGINLATRSFEDLLITGQLRQPAALIRTAQGQGIALKLRLDGPFRQASFDYLVTAPQLRFGTTGLEGVRASGRGRMSRAPVRVPLRVAADRITGVGDVAGGILAHISVDGTVLVSSSSVIGEALTLRSDKLDGKVALFIDLKTGRYDIGLAGQLTRYLIPGIGLVDVKSTLEVVPGPNGRGTRILGRGEAWVRRFDNGFFAGLAGGLPKLETALERTADGQLRFTNLQILAPRLRLTLNGVRGRDGRFQLAGSGSQSVYGPLQISLNGPLARPQIRLLLARPNAALGLANVQLTLDPTPLGYDWAANGQSRLGAFTGQGRLALPRGGRPNIEIADLTAGGIRASGNLAPIPNGLGGSLTLSGAATGRLDMDVASGMQRIRASIDARNARFAGPPAIAMARGSFDGTILLDPRGTSIDGTFSGRDVRYANLTAARLNGSVRLAGGRGDVKATLSGARGGDYTLSTDVRLDQDRILIRGNGALDGRPIQLDTPAILLREASGWRLAPTALRYAGGTAELSGMFGGARPEITAVVSNLPLDLLNLVAPRLGLGGRASGTLFYAEDDRGGPSGRMDMKVRGLSRAGLALSSRAVDLAVAARFGNGEAGARMIAALGGQTIGRGQVRLTGMGGDRPLGAQLANAVLFGQLRYNGDAGTLWRLTGIDTFDLSGTVAVGADISGRFADPVIRGSVRTETARVESAAAGMVLTNVATSGRFDGARLVFDSFSANAGRTGRVTGRGTINFSAQDRGLDIAVEADHAQLIARDDLAATVTGPLRIRSDGAGGVISGDVQLNRSSYVLGQSSAVAAVPRLKLREINGGAATDTVTVSGQPWRLDIKADAPGRLMVSGLGLDSEWRANLVVQGSIFSPAITGTAEMVRGGYEFAGRRFDLQRGNIRFRGESPPDPSLDIVAAGDTQGLSATIRVGGTGLRPEISFASVPALPQDELLSRLLFGTSITNLSAPEAVQLAAAVASMRGGAGLNPINALRKAVGLDRLRILPGDVATGQRTSVAAGKYLTRRTFVEIITDGQGYSATRAEFQVTRWLSILSTISTIGEQSGAVRVSRDY
ncbi:MAG: hypothetical protein RJB22_69 [Pseudomonadota bacterium]